MIKPSISILKSGLTFFLPFLIMIHGVSGQTLNETQMRNARATGYAIVASRNPGTSFSILVIPWDGTNSLEYNANTQINTGWHPQAAVKGNFFDQPFDGSDFSDYSSVVLSQDEFDLYKNIPPSVPAAPQKWWIVCSTLPTFSGLKATTGGDIGIGVSDVSKITAKLTVAGDITSREIRVRIDAGSDFVFDDHYNLMKLEKVAEFIKENKHLPDIDSAKEMEQYGLELGRMDMKLLQKIEELTLYMIEFKDQLNALQIENQKLKSEIDQYKKK